MSQKTAEDRKEFLKRKILNDLTTAGLIPIGATGYFNLRYELIKGGAREVETEFKETIRD